MSEKGCTLAELDKDDWLKAYPELRQITFDVDEDLST